MKTFILASALLLIALSCGQKQYRHYPISMVDIKNVELTDDFWLPKIKTVQDSTIPYGFAKCTAEGRLENFLIAGKKKTGKVHGKMPFDDTDVYKIIEGASYSLISAPNKSLDNYLDSVISIIKIGQEPDGYLTTWFSIDPDNPPAPWVPKSGKRWTREVASHELYNSGHLFEAAAAHYTATGKRNLLEIALKNADLLVKNFGPGKLTIPPGHQIVETGLIKLYQITGNQKYLELAKFFLDLRGDSTTHKLYGQYSQDDKPVTEQTEIAGHAVRAVYMYAGMTDVGEMYSDRSYLNAVKKIWENMVERKIYITGGIGARHEGESLGSDYELPNLTAYGETCASIGDVFWNIRLFKLTGESKYFDLIERTMYNGLISGISADGKNFFYVNPLEADGKFAFNQGAKTRQPWFDCSCCPTNLIRFIPSVPGMIYALSNDILYVNLYASNKANLIINDKKVSIEQKTNYPLDGKVLLSLKLENPVRFILKLRIPGWAENKVMPGELYSYINPSIEKNSIKINGNDFKFRQHNGYAVLNRIWKDGDIIQLILPMEIKHVAANHLVAEDSNLTALEYGPLVYCLEGIDNNFSLKNILIPDDADLHVQKSSLFGGINVITGEVPSKTKDEKIKVTAVPYYAWSNRGEGEMKVWLPRK
ncbi:MAG TPA: glycoside hydrolase family 127 protein [Ignavibacteriaceae bacterium]|nr:glycoside hydrolase family 127 protein [Ignavibacteriaceae bacterium]